MRNLAVVTTSALILLSGATPLSAAPSSAGAHAIVARWRAAVLHGPGSGSIMVADTTTYEGGLQGTEHVVVTADGRYRASAVTAGDPTDLVLTPQNTWVKDWNGFVHGVEGAELKESRTEAFLARTLAFGPPVEMESAAVASDPDNKYDALTFTAPGAKTTTWFFDRATGLPAKVERPSEDGAFVTTLDDWAEAGSHLIPFVENETGGGHTSAVITTIKSAAYPATVANATFARLQSGPSDVHFTSGTSALHIPFNFDSSHIMIEGKVNGHGPIWWLLDTGADQNLINTSRAAAFGFKPYGASLATGGGASAAYQFVKGATFSFPGVEQQNMHAGVLDLDGLEKLYGMELGGLLGYDFYSRFVLVFDYSTKMMDVYEPSTFHYTGNGEIIPFTIENSHLYTNGTISVPTEPNIPARFIIDSGAADTMNLTSPFVKANRLTELAQTSAGVNRTPGAAGFYTQTNVRGLLQNIHVGHVNLQDVPVNFSVGTTGAYSSTDFSGTLGQGIQHRYRVIFDYSRHQMIFEQSALSNAPFPKLRSFGVSLIASGPHYKTLTVSAVRAGSPAEAAGFRVNDIIAAVDGRPATDLSLGEVRNDFAADEKHFAFTVTRGGASVVIPATITLQLLERTP